MTNRHGFSLLELMIAIMILGIGIVMVGTIFPVGLDMTRETIQMDISEAVADAAVATLLTKVPAYNTEIDNYYWYSGGGSTKEDLIAEASGRVLVPCLQARGVDLPSIKPTDFPTSLAAMDRQVVNDLKASVTAVSTPPVAPLSYAGYGVWPVAAWAWPPLTTAVAQEYVSRSTCLTERTGWHGEVSPFNQVSVVLSQNLLASNAPGTSTPVPTNIDDVVTSMLLPVFGHGAGTWRSNGLTRVHLVDQVYPPVPLTADNPKTGERVDRSAADIVGELASRRYSWLAFNHRASSDPKVEGLMVTILVTFRGNLDAKYGRQAGVEDPTGVFSRFFDLDDSDVGHQATWWQPKMEPEPRATNARCLFPRPWLVMLNSINLQNGDVECTTEVARLLPAGSYMVIAETKGDCQAGTYVKVLASEVKSVSKRWDTYTTADWSHLTIARGRGAASEVPVWIVPPALDLSTNPVSFQTRSPVVGVALRKVVAP